MSPAAQAVAENGAAPGAAGLTRQRQQRMADIVYWTSSYDGADLAAGKFNCAAPDYPRFSQTKRAIALVGAMHDDYTACYNAFIANMETAR